MKKLPEFIPEYKIEASTEALKWEELMGWFLVPKLGEKLSWGMYDIPSRKCSHVYDMQVTGKAKVHGIEDVELTAREASYSDKNEVILQHLGMTETFVIILPSSMAMNFCLTGDLVKITAGTKPIWHQRVIFRESVQLSRVLARTSCWIL